MAMKPLAPKPLTPKSKYKFSKPAKPAPGSGNDPVSKALKFFLGDQTKPSGKRNAPKPRAVKLPGTPVPMPKPRERTYPNGKPVPMPQKEGNYGKPRAQQTRPKQTGPAGPKKKSPTFKFATPKKKK